jgi:hypothetical protein
LIVPALTPERCASSDIFSNLGSRSVNLEPPRAEHWDQPDMNVAPAPVSVPATAPC